MNPVDSSAVATLTFIEEHRLQVPIRLLAESLAETICKEARAVGYRIDTNERDEVDGFRFSYRAPLTFKQRWQIEGDCLRAWRARLKNAGLRWADCAPFLAFSLDGVLPEDQAAA